MRARAVLTVERVGDRSVVRELRSQSPLALVPRRGTAAAFERAVTVHLVGSASTPLAGDDVELAVHVGARAELVLTGVAAAIALPGADRPSSLTLRFVIEEGASVQYLPEPTVITARAHHHTLLHAALHPTARLRAREILVGGRAAERAGRYRGTTRVEELPPEVSERSSRSDLLSESSARSQPLLHQTQEFGDPALHASGAVLAGNRVLATEVLVWGADGEAAAGPWWALTPLARRGSLATAVGRDAVGTQRALAEAVAAHPGWTADVLGEPHGTGERPARSVGVSESSVRSSTPGESP